MRIGRMPMRIALTAILLALGDRAVTGEEPTQSGPGNLLDVFPESTLTVGKGGRTVFSDSYSPSGSLWAKGLDEKWVFQFEMRHEQETHNSFMLRIGKGGQVYSLRGPFGESVPPSWRDANSHSSPWNDEVWQFVAVCTRYNGGKTLGNRSPFQTSYFIHNSGAYIPGGSGIKNLYCPLLASEVVPSQHCYRTVNWGLVPQVRTVHRSPILYYCQTRDMGDGVIEMTYVVHNFSVRKDIVFDHLNAPWGGTRVSSLPLRYVSKPDGTMEPLNNSHRIMEVSDTGGWNISCATEATDSPSLALVFGLDKNLESEKRKAENGQPYCQFKGSLYRQWRAAGPMYTTQWKDWRTRPANSFRNYDVAVVIPKIRIVPGATIWYRSYLVVNRKDKAIELAKSLVNKVDYGLLAFDPESTPMVSADAGLKLLAKPVNGTMPLFLIKSTKTGQQVITTDPYIFVPKEKVDLNVPKDHADYEYYSQVYGYSLDKHSSDWQKLLGYGYVNKPETGSWKKLSDVLPARMFPAPTQYHLELWVGEDR